MNKILLKLLNIFFAHYGSIANPILDEYTLKGSQLPEFSQLIQTVTYNILKAWNLIKYHLGVDIIILLLYLLGILVLCVITFKCLLENPRKNFLKSNLINISLTFGNVVHQQNLYEERIGLSIIKDVEDLSNQYLLSLDKIKISFANQEKTSTLKTNNLVQKSLEKYPIINSLAYPYLSPDNFGIIKLKTFGYNIETLPKEVIFRDNKDYYQPIQPPILKRQLYNIYLENNDIFVITFNE